MPAKRLSREELIARLGEVFRPYGYEGASLKLISEATGLGKGSLYHAFPGGKDEMATAVLADVDRWFEENIFAPLADPALPFDRAIKAMLDGCNNYFEGGGRICLMGSFALPDSRDRFATALKSYFAHWISSLTQRLERAGAAEPAASAEQLVLAIQGALVLARALDDVGCFSRELMRQRQYLYDAVPALS